MTFFQHGQRVLVVGKNHYRGKVGQVVDYLGADRPGYTQVLMPNGRTVRLPDYALVLVDDEVGA